MGTAADPHRGARSAPASPLAARTVATAPRSSPDWRGAIPSWWRPRRGARLSAVIPTTRTIAIRDRSSGTSRSSANCRPTSMFSIGYVGSHTQRLEWCCKANYPQGGPFCQNNPAQGFTCPTTPLTQAQITQNEYMPFAAQGWNYSESIGFSTFHALEAQFQKRFSHGLRNAGGLHLGKMPGRFQRRFQRRERLRGCPVPILLQRSPLEGRLHVRHPEGAHPDRGVRTAVRNRDSAG